MKLSSRMEALFKGLPIPDVPLVTPEKRKRSSEAPASVAKRIRKEASGQIKLSSEQAAGINVDKAKLALNDYVKQLAETVDADWHDSYEETGEMLQEWLRDCGKWVQEVIDIGIIYGSGFGCCHELLKHVADTWANIQAIPFRGCPQEDLDAGEGVTFSADGGADHDDEGDRDDDDDAVFHSAEQMLALVWPLLLARAAKDDSVPEGVLLQMIKDAHDHGVEQPHLAPENENLLHLSEEVTAHVGQGRKRLAGLAARKHEWELLPTTKKVHRMRRCIDRRFDGPKHLRTRDFGSDSDEGEACCVM